MKKTLAILLSAVMVLALLAASTAASVKPRDIIESLN